MCSRLKSPTEFNSLVEMMLYFRDEKTCLDYIEQWAWGGKVKCPDCKDKIHKVYRFKNGKILKCSRCSKQFNVKTGTIFEDTRLPLIKWFMAIYFISSHKKGISSHQLAKDINITQCRAYPMLQKIRKALRPAYEGKLSGIVLSDESFIGGKNKNRHLDKKVKNSQGRSFKDKVPVIGLLEKGGEIRCLVMEDTSVNSIRPMLEQHVLKKSTLVTDEWKGYEGLHRKYNHQVVKHNRLQFLSEEGHSTNAVEGFWTHLKKSLVGIYHRVSKKHLQKYLDEMAFRWNTRHMKEGERMNLLMSKVNFNQRFYQ